MSDEYDDGAAYTEADLVTAATLARLEAERAGVRTLLAFAAAHDLPAASVLKALSGTGAAPNDPPVDDDADDDDTDVYTPSPDDATDAERLAAAVEIALAALADGTDPQAALDRLHERGTFEKAAAVPKWAAAVVSALVRAQESGDDLSGLGVWGCERGPQFWIDQMDWHDGKAGKKVIAAAQKAANVRKVIDHKEPGTDGPAVAVFNEGANPEKLNPGKWVDLTDFVPRLKALSGPPVAAVDLDGTLSRYDGWKGDEHFGEPLAGAAEFLSDLRATHRVLIYTTRTKADDPKLERGDRGREELAELVRGWLDQNGLLYDEVYTGQGKPLADVYVDDRAIAVPENPTKEDYATALRAIRTRTFKKAWDESQHPRSKTGQFISRDDIADAKTDPAKAKELRAKVKPADAQKLEDALSGKTDLGTTKKRQAKDAAGAKREAVKANRAKARELRIKLADQESRGEELNPDDLRALIPHLSQMTHEELSRTRAMLERNGATFGGKRLRADRVAALVAWATGKANAKPEAESGSGAATLSASDWEPSADAKRRKRISLGSIVDLGHDAHIKVHDGTPYLVDGSYAVQPLKPMHPAQIDAFNRRNVLAQQAAGIPVVEQPKKYTPEEWKDFAQISADLMRPPHGSRFAAMGVLDALKRGGVAEAVREVQQVLQDRAGLDLTHSAEAYGKYRGLTAGERVESAPDSKPTAAPAPEPPIAVGMPKLPEGFEFRRLPEGSDDKWGIYETGGKFPLASSDDPARAIAQMDRHQYGDKTGFEARIQSRLDKEAKKQRKNTKKPVAGPGEVTLSDGSIISRAEAAKQQHEYLNGGDGYDATGHPLPKVGQEVTRTVTGGSASILDNGNRNVRGVLEVEPDGFHVVRVTGIEGNSSPGASHGVGKDRVTVGDRIPFRGGWKLNAEDAAKVPPRPPSAEEVAERKQREKEEAAEEAARQAQWDMSDRADKEPHTLTKEQYAEADSSHPPKVMNARGADDFTKGEVQKYLAANESEDVEHVVYHDIDPMTGRKTGRFNIHAKPTHKRLVKDALAAGKPVPPEVLADYPDLAAKYAKPDPGPAAAEPAPTGSSAAEFEFDQQVKEWGGLPNLSPQQLDEFRKQYAAAHEAHGANGTDDPLASGAEKGKILVAAMRRNSEAKPGTSAAPVKTRLQALAEKAHAAGTPADDVNTEYEKPRDQYNAFVRAVVPPNGTKPDSAKVLDYLATLPDHARERLDQHFRSGGKSLREIEQFHRQAAGQVTPEQVRAERAARADAGDAARAAMAGTGAAPTPTGSGAAPKDPAKDADHLNALAAQEIDPAVKDAIESAAWNLHGVKGDATAKRRATVEQLAASHRILHDGGNAAGAEKVAQVIASMGGKLHGPAVGEATGGDGRYYEMPAGSFTGDRLTVKRQPVVHTDAQGREFVAGKGELASGSGAEPAAGGGGSEPPKVPPVASGAGDGPKEPVPLKGQSDSQVAFANKVRSQHLDAIQKRLAAVSGDTSPQGEREGKALNHLRDLLTSSDSARVILDIGLNTRDQPASLNDMIRGLFAPPDKAYSSHLVPTHARIASAARKHGLSVPQLLTADQAKDFAEW